MDWRLVIDISIALISFVGGIISGIIIEKIIIKLKTNNKNIVKISKSENTKVDQLNTNK